MSDDSLTTVYPAFDTYRDLWFARIAGGGLGNCFYAYFHAATLAEEQGARLIHPPWPSLKLGPLLRGEPSKRFYIGLFRPAPGDIHGARKLWFLARQWAGRATVAIDGPTHPKLSRGKLNHLDVRLWTFDGLHPHRELIRRRLLTMTRDPLPDGHRWGGGGFVAIHVRLGDFFKVEGNQAVLDAAHGTRLPISWYVNVARQLKLRFPDLPHLVFSDGAEEELKPLLDTGATLYRSGSDVTDLLQMAAASVLVGSNSTYSRWASFLGNMPTIWMKGLRMQKEAPGNRCSSPDVPVVYVPIDAERIDFWS